MRSSRPSRFALPLLPLVALFGIGGVADGSAALLGLFLAGVVIMAGIAVLGRN